MAGYNEKKTQRITRLKAAMLTLFIYAGLVGGLLMVTESTPSELPMKVQEWINNFNENDTEEKKIEQA